LLGYVRGDPHSMSESTRYLVITQSTFHSYFAISPSNDPCAIDHYSIYSSVNPLVPWPSSDTSVRFTGSYGSHKLMIDKTVPTNTKSVWIRARTRGLVTIDQ